MEMQAIRQLVDRYCHAIHTQKAEDFLPLWNQDALCTLITPSQLYEGLDSIYQDFLLECIRKSYSRIDLLTEDVDIRIVGDTAIVIFAYSTDCDLRENGAPFGIAGLETQVYCKTAAGWKLTHIHYSLNTKD